jgi:Transposase, Mutator family
MARRTRRPAPTHHRLLEPCRDRCPHCGGPAHVAYHNGRTVTTLTGVYRLTLRIRRCIRPACPWYRRAYRPEAEGAWALPHGEFGLDVLALVGHLRMAEHRSVPEIHLRLLARGVQLAERTVSYLLERYEELVALQLADHPRLRERLQAQGQAVLALDGLQPDRGHEVLWVIRDCPSGEVLLARSLLSAAQGDLVALLREVQAALPVPVRGVISDGQSSIQAAVQAVFPGVPHQLCQFHYLREAAKPIDAADRHAKKELKKRLRGVRPLERALEASEAAEAADAPAARGYCLAVRAALTDDGRPPLSGAGLRLHDRLQAIAASLDRVEREGGGSPSPSPTSTASSGAGWRPPPRSGPTSASPPSGPSGRRTSWRTRQSWTGRGSAPPTRRRSRRCGPRRRRRAGWARRPRTSSR